MTPQNVSKEGRQLVARLTVYAYRDWDSYLAHQYDEQHNIKNQQGLTNQEYYDQLEASELKYVDHAYADVLADTFADFIHLVVPEYLSQVDIMVTNLDELFSRVPLLRIKFGQLVDRHFLVDNDGHEHVLDDPIKDIRQKYQYYREHFS